MAIEIRDAGGSDLTEILRLYALPDFDDGASIPLEEARVLFNRLRADPHYHFVVAVEAGRVVGTYLLMVMEKLNHLGSKAAIVDDVIVDTAARGRGIGKAMMDHAMQTARRAGCYKLALSSQARRAAAHRFYEGLGFERHGYSYLIRLNDSGTD